MSRTAPLVKSERIAGMRGVDEAAAKLAHEALVMTPPRDAKISQGKSAAELGVPRAHIR